MWYLFAMRKTTFVNVLRASAPPICLAALIAASIPDLAQNSPPVPAALSTDPKELMLLAAKANNLETNEIGPWHLKATFTLFDALGNPADHGTYEEFWLNHHLRKSIVESTGFSQAAIRRDEQFLIVSGSRGGWPDLITKMRIGFIHPAYESKKDYRLAYEESGPGDPSRQCVSAEYKNAPPDPLSTAMFKSSLCFATGNPVLLTRVDALSINTTRTNIFSYHGRYIARDLAVVRDERVYLKAHLESLEELNPVDKTQFNPPRRAYEPPEIHFLYVPNKAAKQIQIRDVAPEYPAAALSARISGVVRVRATIDIDGHVSDAIAIDGPLLLQEPAINAVKKYQFKPATEFGMKCELITVFPVEFKLSFEKQ